VREIRRDLANARYDPAMPALDLLLSLLALTAAVSLRPWRALGPEGPPWPWLAWCAAMPLLWGADRYAAVPVAQPLSGACLLVLMARWPLAVLALVPIAVATMALADLTLLEALHRGVWTGLVPATLALAFGAAVRRGLPNQLFVYILGRGFFATALAGTLAGGLSVALHGVPAGLQAEDIALARFLAAWGDAFLTGMLVAIFVAFRPKWLATYADRIWLRPPG
jgi:uncharacterized membrane protein